MLPCSDCTGRSSAIALDENCADMSCPKPAVAGCGYSDGFRGAGPGLPRWHTGIVYRMSGIEKDQAAESPVFLNPSVAAGRDIETTFRAVGVFYRTLENG